MSMEKVVLVAGGSRGIGAAIARRLACDGMRVALTYSASPDRADQVVREIEHAGGRALSLRADAADPEAVTAAVERTAAAFGRLDVLVSNAGVAAVGRVEELAPEQIDRMIDVNVRGVLHVIRAALPHLGDGGRIITIGSVNAERVPFAGGAAYAMTKAAIAGLVRGLARDLGPRGINVNNIQPGPTANDRMSADSPAADAMLQWLALSRIATPEEIAGLVSYLAGPEAGYITGASLTIDGGFTA
ncbi:3-oxoacyl-ACP reductase FabG [Streptomyces sp. NBS 14/10]|uniref:3-oxoacyl-ACP reductase family protein n=1 Tax=Streptomyces sp. NBS 14/10 TaxID=1945643 RepID=UPI000B7F4839|nr:3-oxoacyl-ACP reductase family protein [Streptomyces sp. NBS 14/10]KAK1185969.1 3-oxoacyl-ACP reductase FabG [Streptomyces sp. NBS 14/10]NUP41132.1 3-oxoacyl-ACP reductase FabG [Streptomyces sp.]NUS87764.1 3-oxoacyl-ACP reductase FabG [Streptomyces sp.]